MTEEPAKLTGPEEVLAVVRSSPALVGAHDREGWLSIFATDAEIEDPVGGVPARRGAGLRKGCDELGRFWDTFIAPNDIVFEAHLDVQADLAVARDVTIHTALPNGFQIAVGAHLLYEVVWVDGVARVQRMRAFWEMSSTSRQGLRGGFKGMAALMGFFWRIIRIQGLGWTWRYCRALYRGVFGRGRKALLALASAASRGSEPELRALFEDPAAARIAHNGTSMPADAFLRSAELGGEWGVAKARASGYWTSASVTFGPADARRRGILFLGFSPRSRRITQVRIFSTD